MDILIKSFIHDVNGPLHIIKGLAGQALKELGEGKERERWQKTSNACEMAQRCVSQTLTVIKAEDGSLRVNWNAVNVHQMCIGLFEQFKTLTDKSGPQFVFQVHRLPNRPVISDELLLHDHVLFNLLTNAFKFTPASGEIRLEIDSEIVDGRNRTMIKISNELNSASAKQLVHRFQNLEKFLGKSEQGQHGQAGFGLGLLVISKMVQFLRAEIQLIHLASNSETGLDKICFQVTL